MPLTDISNRLTPSVPIEITFGTQTIATGTKMTTIFGHMAAIPGLASPYSAYTVINFGSASSAQAEIDNLAGVGSQIGEMVAAFINANSAAPTPRNFPAFRVIFLPYGELHFGPNSEAINTATTLRSDMLVSCYPASDSVNAATLLALAELISGIDRDLQGQFGSFITLGSIDALGTAYNFNSRFVVVAHLPDTNTAAVPCVTGSTTALSNVITAIAQAAFTPTGTTSNGSTTITAVSSTAGIYPGASISGGGIPANSIVESITVNSITISNPANASFVAETLTITNLPTAGIYPGAQLSGTGIPAATVVQSVGVNTITMSNNATSTNVSEAVTVQNVVSQNSEIVAAAHAGAMMQDVYPYLPLQGVTIGGLIPPQKSSDYIQINPTGASETELNAGNSPLYVQAGGTVGFIRTITTFVLLSDNVTRPTAYFDWQDLVLLNDFREDIYDVTQNPPFKNSKATQQVAALLGDEVIRIAQQYEDDGAFQGVKTLAPQFQVQPSTSSRGRFDFFIPVNVVPGLMVIAGNIQAVSGVTEGDFTL